MFKQPKSALNTELRQKTLHIIHDDKVIKTTTYLEYKRGEYWYRLPTSSEVVNVLKKEYADDYI